MARSKRRSRDGPIGLPDTGLLSRGASEDLADPNPAYPKSPRMGDADDPGWSPGRRRSAARSERCSEAVRERMAGMPVSLFQIT